MSYEMSSRETHHCPEGHLSSPASRDVQGPGFCSYHVFAPEITLLPGFEPLKNGIIQQMISFSPIWCYIDLCLCLCM